MATITAYPPTTPALEDLVIIADISQEGNPTRTSTVRDIVNLINFEPIPGEGTVKSVAQTHAGDAFTVTGSPITTQGTLAITLNGARTEYIDGLGNLRSFPTIPTAITLTTIGTTGAASLSAAGVLNIPTPQTITLTTNGTSGASTLVGGVLNVPNYTSGGGGTGTVTAIGAPNDGTSFFIDSIGDGRLAPITTAGDVKFDLSATGTPDETTFLRGDNVWAAPSFDGLPYLSYAAQVQVTNIQGTPVYTETEIYNTLGVTLTYATVFTQAPAYDYSTITPNTAWGTGEVDRMMVFVDGKQGSLNSAHTIEFTGQGSDIISFKTGDNANLFVEIRIYPA
tara:strand:+ start:343 stop:1356 length:1014 start_codon:yes stop_codon:yes gene_type:complete